MSTSEYSLMSKVHSTLSSPSRPAVVCQAVNINPNRQMAGYGINQADGR